MNIMGDFNQQNRPSVFGYDPLYPKATDCVMPSTSSPVYQPLVEPSPSVPQATNTTTIMNSYQTIPNTGPINATTCYTNFESTSSNSNYSFYPNFNSAPYPMTFPFNANSSIDISSITNHVPLRCKRKTDSPIPIKVKQHITEERMAEHMSKLHISSETAPSNPEAAVLKEKRLYMCEEMRKLQATESIIPQMLLNKLEKPCTALVLWKPPPRIFPLSNLVNVNDDDNNNNNEDEVQDNNTMDLEMR